MTKVTSTIKLFVFLAFLLSLGFQARAQVTCQTINGPMGPSIYCDNGASIQQFGGTTFINPPTQQPSAPVYTSPSAPLYDPLGLYAGGKR